MSTLSQILEHKIIAIIRGVQPGEALKIAEALYSGGIRIVEVTLNSEEPFQVIKNMSETFAGKMLIGAGTVLNAESAMKAVEAGAQFILSPIANEGIIKMAKNLGVVSIPGAFTATEIYNAYESGGDIIKVFPAISPSYIKDIAGPLPQIKLLPTGGINLENIRDYKKAGAAGFGIGSALVDTKKNMNKEYFLELSNTAQKFVEAIAD